MATTPLPHAVMDAIHALDLVGTSVTWHIHGNGDYTNLNFIWKRVQAKSEHRNIATVISAGVSMHRTTSASQKTISKRRKTPSDRRRDARRRTEFFHRISQKAASLPVNTAEICPMDTKTVSCDTGLLSCEKGTQTSSLLSVRTKDVSCETMAQDIQITEPYPVVSCMPKEADTVLQGYGNVMEPAVSACSTDTTDSTVHADLDIAQDCSGDVFRNSERQMTSDDDDDQAGEMTSADDDQAGEINSTDDDQAGDLIYKGQHVTKVHNLRIGQIHAREGHLLVTLDSKEKCWLPLKNVRNIEERIRNIPFFNIVLPQSQSNQHSQVKGKGKGKCKGKGKDKNKGCPPSSIPPLDPPTTTYIHGKAIIALVGVIQTKEKLWCRVLLDTGEIRVVSQNELPIAKTSYIPWGTGWNTQF